MYYQEIDVPKFETAAALRAHYSEVKNRAKKVRLVPRPVVARAMVEIKPPPPRAVLVTCEPIFGLYDILKIVSRVSNVSCADLVSPRRFKNVSKTRQAFCWLARKYTARSLPAIGAAIGGKDHSTVHHAIQVVDRDMAMFRPLIDAVSAILDASKPIPPVDPLSNAAGQSGEAFPPSSASPLDNSWISDDEG